MFLLSVQDDCPALAEATLRGLIAVTCCVGCSAATICRYCFSGSLSSYKVR